MPNQSQVYVMPPQAEEGSLASTAYVNPTEVIPGLRAASDVAVGKWVWAATAPAGSNLERTIQQFGANTGSGLPLGLCYRVKAAALPYDQLASNIYKAGQPIPVAKGDAFWVKTATAATVGQKVFAVLADGTTKTGAAGATVSGAIETSFSVVALQNAGAVGDLILISKAGV
jgi:hypothetical protein